MFIRKTRSLLVLLVATLVTAALAATAAPALAAKPSMGPVTLLSKEAFWTARAHVDGASLVAICVSRRCVKAFKPRTGLWILNADKVPTLVRGQRREVIVFAVSPGGEFNYSIQTVTVQ